MSMDDHWFMAMVSQSSLRLFDSHYSICLPVKNKSLSLPNNRSVTEQRAMNLPKRFMRDVKLRTEYAVFMFRQEAAVIMFLC